MFHNVNEDNYFFKKILDIHIGRLKKIFKIDNCKYCGKIREDNSLFSIHKFLTNYEEGKTQPVEKKSIIQERVGNIRVYEISFSQHSDDYDFFESNFVIETSLTDVRNRSVPITNGMAKIKCSFSLISIQLLMLFSAI